VYICRLDILQYLMPNSNKIILLWSFHSNIYILSNLHSNLIEYSWWKWPPKLFSHQAVLFFFCQKKWLPKNTSYPLMGVLMKKKRGKIIHSVLELWKSEFSSKPSFFKSLQAWIELSNWGMDIQWSDSDSGEPAVARSERQRSFGLSAL
jgi:hypothetical protein